MIDWVSAVIPFVHEPLNGGSVFKVLPSGEVDWETRCRIIVEGSYGTSFTIRSQGGDGKHRATELYISGNPSKFLQGHNIFGSDDLLSLVYDSLVLAGSMIGISFPKSVLQAVREGQYSLTRLDINYMFELPTLRDVNLWIRNSEYNSETRHGRPTNDGGTLYWGYRSKRWNIKAYSKGAELNAGGSHSLPDPLTDTPLLDYAQNKLRIELTLRGKELEKIGLREAHKWRDIDPYSIYCDYVKRIEMSERMALTMSVVDNFPGNVKGTYMLWHDGHDPRNVLSKNTFYKHRRILLEHGIDIKRMPDKVDRSNVIPLIRVLEAVPVGIPGWAFDMNLVHPSTVRRVVNG